MNRTNSVPAAGGIAMEELLPSSAFGALLRRHRLAAGLSQEALAERARMSAHGIGALERGYRRTPQRETLALLTQALGLDAEQRRVFEAAAARPPLLRPGDRRVSSTPTLRPAGSRRGHNLPLSLTSFVGRETEVGEIAALIREHRLVTLTGTGGIGKTRTALQVAEALGDWAANGVWLVELAPLRDPSLIAATIARTLELEEAPTAAPLETLLGYLKDKELVLVLDNCEHVVAEATQVVNALLQGCSGLRILATSREALGKAGEYIYLLPPLGVPSREEARRLTASDCAKYGALVLFAERARAAERRFALTDGNAAIVADICRRLDGIPFAIELAAARVTILPVKALAERLDRRFQVLTSGDRAALPRHQTMRALIDWSYDLLTEREQRAFARMSVFAGGWTFEAYEAVCCDDDNERERLELLASLVAKSLVMVEDVEGEPRYHLLESTKDYAHAHLSASEEFERMQRRHALYYATFLCERRCLWEAMDDLVWQRALLAELDNLRSALDWSLTQGGDRRLGLEMLSFITVPMLVFGHDEAQHWFGLAWQYVDEADVRVATAFRCRYADTMDRLNAPVTVHVAVCKENVSAARALGDPILLADALRALANAYRRDRRLGEADDVSAEAWNCVPSGQKALASRIVYDWACTDLYRERFESARNRFTLALRMASPGSQMHALALMGLAETEFSAGQVRAAIELGQAAMLEFRALGMALPQGVLSTNLAWYAIELGSFEEARRSLAEALRIFCELGVAYWLAVVMEKHALFAALTHDDETATALLGYTRRQDALLNRVRQTAEQHSYDRILGLLRERLGEDELERQLLRGADLTASAALQRANTLVNRDFEGAGGTGA